VATLGDASPDEGQAAPDLPTEVRGWNWGAWLVPPFWASYYRIWWAVAAVAVPLPLYWPLEVVDMRLLALAQIPVAFLLGAKGNEWAWRKWRGRRWKSVNEFEQEQRRWVWGGLAVVVAGIAISAGALDSLVSESPSSAPRVFTGHGVTFRYPGNWRRGVRSDVEGFGPVLGESTWAEPLARDRNDLVLVSQVGVSVVITPGNIELWAEGVSTSPLPSGSTLLQPFRPKTIAGMPAIQGSTRVTTSDGTQATQITTFVYRGTAELRWDCQYTAAHRVEMLRGCNMLERTLEIEDGFTDEAGWRQLRAARVAVRVWIPPGWKSTPAAKRPRDSALGAEIEGAALLLYQDERARSLRANTAAILDGLRADPTWRRAPALHSREAVRIPAGRAERIHLRARAGGPLRIIAYSLFRDGRGYALIGVTSEVDADLLAPTLYAIAQRLELE
jgi:hypothetical protein